MPKDLFLKLFIAYITNQSLHGSNAKSFEKAFLVSATIATTGSMLSWMACVKDIIDNKKYSTSQVFKNCFFASSASLASCALGISLGIAILNNGIKSKRLLSK
jgi:hypothetical protein